jgi:hypothetical protein
MPPSAYLVHRSRGRIRLRVPSRRRDLDYFLGLYEQLRHEPVVDEVTMNPVTAGVLVLFDEADAEALPAALPRGDLLALETAADNTLAPVEPRAGHVTLNDMRTIVFLIMAALSLQQLLKGQLLAPLVTMGLYLLDWVAGMRLESYLARLQEAEDGDDEAIEAGDG